MDIRVLRYFLAVSQEENISGAALRLNVSQPTLSRQLMELEEELDAKLFNRGNRGISLTEEGMLLRKRAEEIVSLMDKTKAEFASPHEIISGTVFIGAGETEAVSIIARVATDLRSEYSGISFDMHSGRGSDVMERIDKGLLDFGLVLGPVNEEKYNTIKFPVADTWGVLMRNDSPLADKELIEPEDLFSQPLIVSRRQEITDWFEKSFDELNVVSYYNLIYNASLMVAEGMGYALCIKKFIHTNKTNMCFKPLAQSPETPLFFIWKKKQIFSKAAKLFLVKLSAELNSCI